MVKSVKFSLFIFLAITVVSACTPSKGAPPPDEISVRLKWLHGIQFAGLYLAEQKGFFEEENLSVTLEAGGLEFDEIALVSSGQDDFGIVAASQLVMARSEGMPIKAVAAIFQISPAVYFALRESGIEHPEDFIGKRVVVNPADFKLPIMLANVGVDSGQIDAVPPSHDLETFYNREEDVWSGYITNEVARARLDGYELNIIFPSDYGVYEYGDCIIATDEMIQENPELVERFIKAALRGWRYAIENPAEAAAVSSHYSDVADDDFQLASMEAQIPLIHTGEVPVGWMRPEVWAGTYDMLLKQEKLAGAIDVEQVYTQDFLRVIYGAEP